MFINKTDKKYHLVVRRKLHFFYIFEIPLTKLLCDRSPTTMKLHEKIKLLRKKRRMTQAQVAEMLFNSQNSYSLIETGKTRIDI